MRPEDPEGIEDIMPVISESERVDNGVEMDHSQDDRNHRGNGQQSWQAFLLLWESVLQKRREVPLWNKHVGHRDGQNRPRKEQKVRPDVKHLRQMQAGTVEFLVSCECKLLNIVLDIADLPRTTPSFHRTNPPNAARIVIWGITEITTGVIFLKPVVASDTAVLK